MAHSPTTRNQPDIGLSLRVAPLAWLSRVYGEHSSQLLRLAIIAGVLLLSARMASSASLRDIAVIVAALAVFLLLRVPPLGLVALIAAGLGVPFTIGTGTQTTLNVAILMIPALAGLWLVEMLRRRHFQIVSSRTTLPLLAFVAAATISFLAGGILWNLFARTAPLTTQAGGWAIFVFSAVAFLLVANQIKEVRWLEIFTGVFLVLSGVYMCARLLPPLYPISSLMNDVSVGSLFWVWTAALAAGQLLFNRKAHLVLRVGLALVLGLTLYIGWFVARSWTSGWLPPMIAVGVILWLRSWRLGLLVTFAAVLFVFVFHPELMDRVLSTESYSIHTRDAARDILLTQVLPLSPIFGLGPANYYWYTPLYPILGWYVSFNSHNNFVDILMQTGVLGMAFFAWFAFEVGRLGWNLRKRFVNDFAQGYVYGCLGGLAGTLVACWLADWLLPFVYNIGLNGFRASMLAWLFWGGLVSLENIARQSQTTDVRTPTRAQ
jgi:hypothetical protein